MPTYTPNLKLIKPEPEDFYSVADFNANADLVDGALTDLREDMALSDQLPLTPVTGGRAGSGQRAARHDHRHPTYTVPANEGGTGRTTLTSGYFLRGAGTGAVTLTAPGSVGPAIGRAYGTCSTAAATLTKVVNISGFTRCTGAVVAVTFTYAVPAGASLNVTSTGAAAMVARGGSVAARDIPAGATATFIFDGSAWRLLAVDTGATDLKPYIVGTFTGNDAASRTFTTVDESGVPFTPSLVLLSSAEATSFTFVFAPGAPYGRNRSGEPWWYEVITNGFRCNVTGTPNYSREDYNPYRYIAFK